ncbi:hypothetical protein NY78_3520 [Desulfovibrio sp. TomC]|nr:hypothetical protein NY78_3520 [Desulfovibrio sp. TomC]
MKTRMLQHRKLNNLFIGQKGVDPFITVIHLHDLLHETDSLLQIGGAILTVDHDLGQTQPRPIIKILKVTQNSGLAAKLHFILVGQFSLNALVHLGTITVQTDVLGVLTDLFGVKREVALVAPATRTRLESQSMNTDVQGSHLLALVLVDQGHVGFVVVHFHNNARKFIDIFLLGGLKTNMAINNFKGVIGNLADLESIPRLKTVVLANAIADKFNQVLIHNSARITRVGNNVRRSNESDGVHVLAPLLLRSSWSQC